MHKNHIQIFRNSNSRCSWPSMIQHTFAWICLPVDKKFYSARIGLSWIWSSEFSLHSYHCTGVLLQTHNTHTTPLSLQLSADQLDSRRTAGVRHDPSLHGETPVVPAVPPVLSEVLVDTLLYVVPLVLGQQLGSHSDALPSATWVVGIK